MSACEQLSIGRAGWASEETRDNGASNPQVQWKAPHRLVWVERGHCQRPFAGMWLAGSGLQSALTLHPESLLNTANLQAAGWSIKQGKIKLNKVHYKQQSYITRAVMQISGQCQRVKNESLFSHRWHRCPPRLFLLWKPSLIIPVMTPERTFITFIIGMSRS